jgi:hypothetical protein
LPCVCADSRGEGREGEGRGGEGGRGEVREGEGRGGRCICADAHVCADVGVRPRGRTRSAWTRVCPRGRMCFIPGNFKKVATVRLSHGPPRGHRPTVYPSVIVRASTLVYQRTANSVSAYTDNINVIHFSMITIVVNFNIHSSPNISCRL